MVEKFHGARVFQSGNDPVSVSLVSTSTVGLLIAVDPTDLPSGVAIDTPILLNAATDAAQLPANVREHVDSVYDQSGCQIVLILIDAGAEDSETQAAAVGDATQLTGIHAFKKATSLGLPSPKILAAPGLTVGSVADGVLTATVTAGGTGYTTADVTVAGATGGTGAELEAVMAGGVITGINIIKPGTGYTGALTVTITGDGSDATGSATAGTVLNAVIAEAQGIAETLRGFFYADGPDGTDAQAVQARQLIGSRYVKFVDPRVLKSVDGTPVAYPSSAIWAGLRSKMDQLFGPHYEESNQLINGIQGTNRPVTYGVQSNYLNQNGVNTIINRGNGFRTWGARTCAVGTIWEFASVVRMANLVNESIERAFIQFVDRPITKGLLDQMTMSGLAVLVSLENQGMLLPGSEFGLSSEQTGDDGVQGILKFAMRYEPPAPANDIRIAAYRNTTIAYELLYDQISGTVDTGNLI
ncbi:hypothetical protein SAMN05444339_10280 [Loktanella atrilutea]|uniref:Tail sheath protein subtilisin-like domain-containing protein n=1 Tax=Loktanella atrilutea TaxID=366533 RepID=A0A1M4WDN9_LOKAT|nr:phage tail sheath subtilisin-like domain-containing protein [Loktanella atrilutea]SHE79368.1 hypothetical protein SAMN05444339_10280 [Loktanella atrilutea]